MWVGASGVRLGTSWVGAPSVLEAFSGCSAHSCGLCLFQLHRWVSQPWSELPCVAKVEQPRRGSEGRSWLRACGQPAPLSCAERVVHQRGGMRACALHGGPASNGREGTSLILAGHQALCPGTPPTSPSSVGVVCGVQTQWQRPGTSGSGCGPCSPGPFQVQSVPEELLNFALGGPSGVHAPLVLCGWTANWREVIQRLMTFYCHELLSSY